MNDINSNSEYSIEKCIGAIKKIGTGAIKEGVKQILLNNGIYYKTYENYRNNLFTIMFVDTFCMEVLEVIRNRNMEEKKKLDNNCSESIIIKEIENYQEKEIKEIVERVLKIIVQLNEYNLMRIIGIEKKVNCYIEDFVPTGDAKDLSIMTNCIEKTLKDVEKLKVNGSDYPQDIIYNEILDSYILKLNEHNKLIKTYSYY